jgi:hypothetical protein
MTTSTITTIPSASSSFISDLQTFLREEDAQRFKLTHQPFCQANGIHGTAAGLTGYPGTTIGFPGGYHVSETGTITYTDNKSNNWVVLHKDLTTAPPANWRRESGTHYMIEETSTSQPSLPTDSIILMRVTTASGAITAVDDLRDRSAQSTQNQNYVEYRLVANVTLLTVVATVGGSLRLPFNCTIQEAGAYVDTAGTTGTTTIDINLNGTTIFSVNKISIETGETSSLTAAQQPVLTTTTYTRDDILTFDVDAISTGTAPRGLVVWLKVLTT